MGGRGSYSNTRKRSTIKTSSGRTGQRKPNPMNLSQFSGMTLQDIENRIRNLDHEELFVVDKNGDLVGAYKGLSDSVAFYASELTRDGATVTHGHPKGAEGYGATFSVADVLNMAASDWAEHRVAASGQGEMNYIIRRTSKTTQQNSKDLYNKIKKDQTKLESQMSAAANKVKGLSDTAKRQIYTGLLDRYYSTILPRYNFEYIKRKEPYKYNR